MKKQMTHLILGLAVMAVALFTGGCATQHGKNKNGVHIRTQPGSTNFLSFAIEFGTNGYPLLFAAEVTNVDEFEIKDDSKLGNRGVLASQALRDFAYRADSLFTGRETTAGVAALNQDVSTNAAPIVEAAVKGAVEGMKVGAGLP